MWLAPIATAPRLVAGKLTRGKSHTGNVSHIGYKQSRSRCEPEPKVRFSTEPRSSQHLNMVGATLEVMLVKELGKEIVETFKIGKIENLYLFVTSTCNAKCNFCFYWDELNKHADMTFAEIRHIAESLRGLRTLMISGGEPFIRKDLPEIVHAFARNGVHSISIPTNGTLKDRTVKMVKQMLEENPELYVSVGISLDDFAEQHNRIRQIRKCFEKALQTLRELQKLQKNYPNLRVTVSTVLSGYNHKRIDAFVDFVKTLNVDDHNIELVRGNPEYPESFQNYRAFAEHYFMLHPKVEHHYRITENTKRANPRLGKLGKAAQYAFGLMNDQSKRNVVLQKKPWPFACVAGKRFIVIDHNGILRACELRGKVLNLRDYDFDVPRALASAPMQEELRRIAKARCWDRCTHGCFIEASMRYTPKAMLVQVPLLYAKDRVKALFDRRSRG